MATPFGEVGLKRALLPDGGARVKIEHDDLAAIARRQDLPLEEVRRRVRCSLIEAGDPWFAPALHDPEPTPQAPSPPPRP